MWVVGLCEFEIGLWVVWLCECETGMWGRGIVWIWDRIVSCVVVWMWDWNESHGVVWIWDMNVSCVNLRQENESWGCVNETSLLSLQGCLNEVKSFILHRLYIFGIVAIVLGVIQVWSNSVLASGIVSAQHVVNADLAVLWMLFNCTVHVCCQIATRMRGRAVGL